jgi:hypothetical protein
MSVGWLPWLASVAGSLVGALLVAQSIPSQYLFALQRAEYQVFSGGNYAVYSVIQSGSGFSDVHLVLFHREGNNWFLEDF